MNYRTNELDNREPIMKLTLGQAAKECGKSKSTISNAIKSGKLSVLGQTSAGYEIDPAELFRVFPKRSKQNELDNREPPLNTSVITEMATELGRAKAERDALQEQINLLREMLTKSEAHADEWRKQAQTLALTDQRQKGGFWSFLKKAG
jgi:hypothetical protein